MGTLGLAWRRLMTVWALPDCARCGAPMTVADEERVSTAPPVFDLDCRCPRCGAVVRVRQALSHFE